ncbi:hypothetical protein J6590_062740 [Homalodisca vitripennis]|nr:hypothetical protein J6590_062740 [Homalodisca vitripennis]
MVRIIVSILLCECIRAAVGTRKTRMSEGQQSAALYSRVCHSTRRPTLPWGHVKDDRLPASAKTVNTSLARDADVNVDWQRGCRTPPSMSSRRVATPPPQTNVVLLDSKTPMALEAILGYAELVVENIKVSESHVSLRSSYRPTPARPEIQLSDLSVLTARLRWEGDREVEVLLFMILAASSCLPASIEASHLEPRGNRRHRVRCVWYSISTIAKLWDGRSDCLSVRVLDRLSVIPDYKHRVRSIRCSISTIAKLWDGRSDCLRVRVLDRLSVIPDYKHRVRCVWCSISTIAKLWDGRSDCLRVRVLDRLSVIPDYKHRVRSIWCSISTIAMIVGWQKRLLTRPCLGSAVRYT